MKKLLLLLPAIFTLNQVSAMHKLHKSQRCKIGHEDFIEQIIHEDGKEVYNYDGKHAYRTKNGDYNSHEQAKYGFYRINPTLESPEELFFELKQMYLACQLNAKQQEKIKRINSTINQQ